MLPGIRDKRVHLIATLICRGERPHPYMRGTSAWRVPCKLTTVIARSITNREITNGGRSNEARCAGPQEYQRGSRARDPILILDARARRVGFWFRATGCGSDEHAPQ